MKMKHWLAGCACAVCLFGAGPVMAQDASLHQIYQAASSGHLDQAQAMMAQVLKDHPDSGKAHFVEAELLGKQGRIEAARQELARAEQLAPGLPFARPAAIQELQQVLAGRAAPRQAGSSIPWGGILVAVLALAFVFALFRRRQMGSAYPGGAYGGGGYPAYGRVPPGGPMGGAPMGGGMGSGILGGLATGAAMGAGFAAGEALVDRLLDEHGNPVGGSVGGVADGGNLPYDNMGGDGRRLCRWGGFG